MKRAVIAAVVVFVVAGTTAVYAQHWPGRWPLDVFCALRG